MTAFFKSTWPVDRYINIYVFSMQVILISFFFANKVVSKSSFFSTTLSTYSVLRPLKAD